MRIRLSLFLFSAALAACSSDRDLLDSGDTGVDAAFDRGVDVAHDGGAIGPDVSDAGSDSGIDVVDVAMDAGSDAPDAIDVRDRGDARDVTADTANDAGPSGRCVPVIDGVIGSDWAASAITTSNTVATAWGVGLNELRSVRVCYDSTALYLGIDGEVESTNAIVAYIDRDYDPPGGAPTGVSIFSALSDRIGALDTRVSASLSLGAGAGNFGAEAAWGTDGMLTLAGTALSDNAGLRLISQATGTLPTAGRCRIVAAISGGPWVRKACAARPRHLRARSRSHGPHSSRARVRRRAESGCFSASTAPTARCRRTRRFRRTTRRCRE